MINKTFITPEYTTAQEIKNTRKILNLTQKEFAGLVGCSKATIERWETSTGKITGPICLLLKLLNIKPEYIEVLQVPKKTMPLRLIYMHEKDVQNLLKFVNEYSDNEKKRVEDIILYQMSRYKYLFLP